MTSFDHVMIIDLLGIIPHHSWWSVSDPSVVLVSIMSVDRSLCEHVLYNWWSIIYDYYWVECVPRRGGASIVRP